MIIMFSPTGGFFVDVKLFDASIVTSGHFVLNAKKNPLSDAD